jgi:hypothetical protein
VVEISCKHVSTSCETFFGPVINPCSIMCAQLLMFRKRAKFEHPPHLSECQQFALHASLSNYQITLSICCDLSIRRDSNYPRRFFLTLCTRVPSDEFEKRFNLMVY